MHGKGETAGGRAARPDLRERARTQYERWRRDHPERVDGPLLAFLAGGWLALAGGAWLAGLDFGVAAAIAGACLSLALTGIAGWDLAIKWWGGEEALYLGPLPTVRLLALAPPVAFLVLGMVAGHLAWK